MEAAVGDDLDELSVHSAGSFYIDLQDGCSSRDAFVNGIQTRVFLDGHELEVDHVGIESTEWRLGRTALRLSVGRTERDNGQDLLQVKVSQVPSPGCDVTRLDYFKALLQIRLKQMDVDSRWAILDQDVFGFSPFLPPYEWLVSSFCDLVLEARLVGLTISDWPNVQCADVQVVLEDNGPGIPFMRALLCVNSEYLKSTLDRLGYFEIEDPHLPELRLLNVIRVGVLELLAQCAAVERPIDVNVDQLAEAARKTGCNAILYRLGQMLAFRSDVPLTARIKQLAELKLIHTLRELVWSTAQTSAWSQLIASGFDPAAECGSELFRTVIAPIVLKAQSNAAPRGIPYSTPPVTGRNLLEPMSSSVGLRLLGTDFYVSQAEFCRHVNASLSVSSDGRFELLYTREWRQACRVAQISPGQVVVDAFQWISPSRRDVPPSSSRAVLAFAHTHQMPLLKAHIESILSFAPATTPAELVDLFYLADHFQLHNLRLKLLFRVETGYSGLAKSMLDNESLCRLLSSEVHADIVARLSSCWDWEKNAYNFINYQFGSQWFKRGALTPVIATKSDDTMHSLPSSA